MIAYENLVTWRDGRVTIRVWLSRDIDGPKAHADEVLVASSLSRLDTIGHIDIMAIATTACARIGSRVNAIEVRSGDVASLIYPDWP